MASPCDYIYKGKKYTHNEFRSLMVAGEFDRLVSEKKVSEPKYATEKLSKKTGKVTPEIQAKRPEQEAPQLLELKKKKGKKWDMPEYLKRRDRELREEPASLEEHILLTMLAMNDKQPENKFSFKSLVKDIPKGAKERRVVKQFASDHPKAKNIDQFAQDLIHSYQDGGSGEAFGLGGMESKEIADVIRGLVSRFESKHDLLEHLEDLRKERREAENIDNIGRYEMEVIGVDSDGELVYNIKDRAQEITDHELSEIYNPDDKTFFEGYTDEGHPIYKELSDLEISIADANTSEADSAKIVEYAEQFIKDNGEVDFDKFAASYTDAKFREFMDSLSPKGQDTLREILIFSSKEEQPQSIKDIIKKTEDYVSEKRRESKDADKQAAVAERPSAEESKRDTEGAGEIPLRPDSQRDGKSAKERIKEIDLELKRQRASQAIEAAKRAEANKAKDVEAFNKHNDNWSKKQAKIDKLNEERAEIETQARKDASDELRKVYKNRADQIREFADNLDDTFLFKDRTGLEGVSRMGDSNITKALVRKLSHLVADAFELTGNLHVAIKNGIAKLKASKEPGSEMLNDMDVKELYNQYKSMYDMPTTEPEIKGSLREDAIDLLNEIEAGEVDYWDAVNEVLSSNLSDKKMGEVLNFIDWHAGEREYHNSITLNEPKYKSTFLEDFQMPRSEELTRYLSDDTIKEVTGESVIESVEAEKLKIQPLVTAASDIVGRAKNHYGDNVLDYGPKLLQDILRLEGDETKKVTAMVGLSWELRAERTRNPEKADQINNILRPLEKAWKETLREASKTLNAARANRQFRNEHYSEMFAEQVMSDAQKAQKREYEKSLNDVREMDKAIERHAEEGVLRDADTVEKEEAVKSKARKEKEDKPGTEEKKKKSAVDKIRDVFRKKKGDQREAKPEKYYKDRLEKTKKEIGDPKSFFEKLKNEIKKDPC